MTKFTRTSRRVAALIFVLGFLISEVQAVEEAVICRMGASGDPIVSLAAEELKTHLERFFGKKVTVADGEVPAPKEGLRFILGAGPEEAPTTGLPGDYAIVIRGNLIWLWGYDEVFGQPKWNIKNSQRGTMHAVYQFLQEFGGIRWLIPGEDNIVRKNPGSPLHLPESFSKVYSPRFSWLNVDQYGGADVGNYYWRQKQRVFPGHTYSFMHHWGTLLGYNHYFATHPEYYPLIGGTRKPFPDPNPKTGRTATMGTQICSSNPDLVNIFAKEIIKRYRKGEAIVPISPNDGQGFCECEKCRALDRPDLYSTEETADLDERNICLSDRIFSFVNAVAKKVKSECPEARLGIHLYSYYVIPPKTIEHLEDNIVGDYCLDPAHFNDPVYRRETLRRINEWHEKGLSNMTFYLYMDSHWWSQVLHIHTKALAEFIKHAAQLPWIYGGKTESTGGYATNALNFYVFFALMNDPSRELDDVVQEFCTLAYGPAAEPMKKFYALAEEAFMRRDSKPWMVHAEMVRWYDDAFFQEAEALLSKAQEKARTGSDPAWAHRVALTQDALDHTRNMRDFIQCAVALQEYGISFYLPHLGKNYRSSLSANPKDPAVRDALIARAETLRETMLERAERTKGSLSFSKEMLKTDTVGRWGDTMDLLKLVRGADEVQILNKSYPFQTDPANRGETEEWFLNKFSDHQWPKLRLTGFWEDQGFGEPAPNGYDGFAWYRIPLGAFPEKLKGHHITLHFGAVDESCWVWVNGKKVGEVLYNAKTDPNGWNSPRSFDITDAVYFDKPNLIAIRVLDTDGKGGLWKGGLITFHKLSDIKSTTTNP